MIDRKYREHVGSVFEAGPIETDGVSVRRSEAEIIEAYRKSTGAYRETIESLRAQLTTARKALEEIIVAWESLDAGYYNATKIDKWLNRIMKPAIDCVRAALNPNEQKQPISDDWPYPTIDPTCAQDLK